jgi:phage tail-like protein
MADPGLGLRFKVRIDGRDIGNWQKVDGLTLEYDMFEYAEGGENAYVHRLPGRVKYQNIKLTRPIDGDSATVHMWLQSLQLRMVPATAQISVLDPGGVTVATWSLAGVYPVRWTGPSLDVGSNQWATETLELSHNGFVQS